MTGAKGASDNYRIGSGESDGLVGMLGLIRVIRQIRFSS